MKKLFFLILLFLAFIFVWQPCFAAKLGTVKGIVLGRRAYETLGELVAPAVVGFDGVTYLADDSCAVYAFNPDGTLRWTYEILGEAVTQLIAGPDGAIYLGTDSWEVYALNPDGTEKWTYDTPGEPAFSPFIGPDGTVYLGSAGGNVSALNSNGSEKWNFEALGELVFSPLIAPNGTVYAGSEGGYLYALSSKGDLKWTYETLGELVFSPVVGANAVFIIDDNKTVYALNPDGSLKWEYETFGDLASPATIGPDGAIYLATSDWEVYALDSDGELKWDFSAPGPVSALTIGAEGEVYARSDRGISALNKDGNLKWNYESSDDLIASAPVFSAGKLLIGNISGSVSLLNADDGRQVVSYQAPAELNLASLSLSVQADNQIYLGDDAQLFSLEVGETEGLCSENNSGALNIEGVQGKVGDEITIPVRAQSTPKAISAFGFEATYPADVLEYVGFEKGILTVDFESVSAVIPSTGAGRIRAGGFSSADIPSGSSGTIILLRFKVIGEPTNCYPLELENLKDDVAQFSKSGGCFCVSVCNGDQNGDGEWTPSDSLIIFRCYLETGPCNECSDVNLDGEVTPSDSLCVFKKYLDQPSCLDALVPKAAASRSGFAVGGFSVTRH